MGLRRYVGAILALALAACSGLSSTVKIINDTDTPFTDGRLVIAGQEIWSGQLDAGSTESISFKPAMDGTLDLSGQLNGEAVQSGPKGYVTPNEARTHTLLIGTDRNITYSAAR